MTRSVLAGSVYFAAVFAIGFTLGAVRTLLLAPAVGELTATLIELPVILGLSWIVCGRVIAHCRVPGGIAPRAVMGLTAFVLLMAAEGTLFMLMTGGSLGAFLAQYQTAPHLIGLAGQILFALFPMFRR